MSDRETLAQLKALAEADETISAWGTDGGELERIHRQAQYITALESECERLRNAAEEFGQMYLEEIHLRHKVQNDAAVAIGRDPHELYPLFEAVQNHWVSLARAVEYARDWLTGLPCEPPTSNPFDDP